MNADLAGFGRKCQFSKESPMAVQGKVRTKLLHCSKNEARVSYTLGPMISLKNG
jgi:hypothetical protein